MNALKSMLSEADGSVSSLRVVMVLFIGYLVFEHIYLLVQTGRPEAWDWQQLAALTALVAGKAAQKPFEAEAPASPPQTSPKA